MNKSFCQTNNHNFQYFTHIKRTYNKYHNDYTDVVHDYRVCVDCGYLEKLQFNIWKKYNPNDLNKSARAEYSLLIPTY